MKVLFRQFSRRMWRTPEKLLLGCLFMRTRMYYKNGVFFDLETRMFLIKPQSIILKQKTFFLLFFVMRQKVECIQKMWINKTFERRLEFSVGLCFRQAGNRSDTVTSLTFSCPNVRCYYCLLRCRAYRLIWVQS